MKKDWCLVEDPENINLDNICDFCNFWIEYFREPEQCKKDKNECYLDCLKAHMQYFLQKLLTEGSQWVEPASDLMSRIIYEEVKREIDNV